MADNDQHYAACAFGFVVPPALLILNRKMLKPPVYVTYPTCAMQASFRAVTTRVIARRSQSTFTGVFPIMATPFHRFIGERKKYLDWPA